MSKPSVRYVAPVSTSPPPMRSELATHRHRLTRVGWDGISSSTSRSEGDCFSSAAMFALAGLPSSPPPPWTRTRSASQFQVGALSQRHTAPLHLGPRVICAERQRVSQPKSATAQRSALALDAGLPTADPVSTPSKSLVDAYDSWHAKLFEVCAQPCGVCVCSVLGSCCVHLEQCQRLPPKENQPCVDRAKQP